MSRIFVVLIFQNSVITGRKRKSWGGLDVDSWHSALWLHQQSLSNLFSASMIPSPPHFHLTLRAAAFFFPPHMDHFKRLYWICYNIASVLFWSFFFFFGWEACEILAPQPGTEPTPPALDRGGSPLDYLLWWDLEADWYMFVYSMFFPQRDRKGSTK